MGLDLSAEGSPLDPSWAYSGFMRFRERLAAHAGIPDLRAMEGFGGEKSWDSVDTPLRPFLDHSDCEGDLSWQDCERVEPELRRIVETFNEDHGWGDYDREHGLVLADLMRHCAIVQVPLEFH